MESYLPIIVLSCVILVVFLLAHLFILLIRENHRLRQAFCNICRQNGIVFQPKGLWKERFFDQVCLESSDLDITALIEWSSIDPTLPELGGKEIFVVTEGVMESFSCNRFSKAVNGLTWRIYAWQYNGSSPPLGIKAYLPLEKHCITVQYDITPKSKLYHAEDRYTALLGCFVREQSYL